MHQTGIMKEYRDMSGETVTYCLAGWGILLVVALVNGYVRNATYEKSLGNKGAHYVSVAVVVGASCAVAYVMMHWFTVPPGQSDAIGIGLFWVFLSLVFEFGIGHYIARMSWKKLLEDYDLSRGKVLILVLLAQLFAPLLAWHFTFQ
jgi:uncharacterized membrane protein YraQ (UPF0718 family)